LSLHDALPISGSEFALADRAVAEREPAMAFGQPGDERALVEIALGIARAARTFEQAVLPHTFHDGAVAHLQPARAIGAALAHLAFIGAEDGARVVISGATHAPHQPPLAGRGLGFGIDSGQAARVRFPDEIEV